MRELDPRNRRRFLESIGSVGLATAGMGALSSQTAAADELLYKDGPKETWSFSPTATVDQFGPQQYSVGQNTVICYYGDWENEETDAFEPEFSVTTCASATERDIGAHYVSAEGGDNVSFRYAARSGLTLHAYPESGDQPNMGDFSAEVIKQAVQQIPGMDFVLGYRDLLDAYASRDDFDSDPDSVSYESPWFGLNGQTNVSHTMWFRPTITGDSGTVTVTSGITTRQDGKGTTEVTKDFTVGQDYAVVQRHSSYYR